MPYVHCALLPLSVEEAGEVTGMALTLRSHSYNDSKKQAVMQLVWRSIACHLLRNFLIVAMLSSSLLIVSEKTDEWTPASR